MKYKLEAPYYEAGCNVIQTACVTHLKEKSAVAAVFSAQQIIFEAADVDIFMSFCDWDVSLPATFTCCSIQDDDSILITL